MQTEAILEKQSDADFAVEKVRKANLKIKFIGKFWGDLNSV